VLRQDSNAGALSSQQVRPRGGGQTEECDGTTRVEAESCQTHQSTAKTQKHRQSKVLIKKEVTMGAIEEYLYCDEHDIYFNQKLQDEADEKNKKLEEEGSLIRIDACPMCKQKIILMVASLRAPSERSQREELMDEPHFRHAGGKQKQYIWMERTPPATPAKTKARKNNPG
jgi:hypothetical protein